jgi:uncharacterized Tic20 family protein
MDEQNQTGQPAGPVEAGQTETSQDAKNMGMLCHLLGLLTSFVGPLILWLIQKDKMPFVDHQGKEALNFQITVLIAYFRGRFFRVCFVWYVLVPAVILADLILSIIACVAASGGILSTR